MNLAPLIILKGSCSAVYVHTSTSLPPPCVHNDRYVPLLWFDDQRVMDPASAATLHEEFLSYVDFALETAWKGLIASAALAVLGSILWSVFVFLKVKHDRRVWVD